MAATDTLLVAGEGGGEAGGVWELAAKDNHMSVRPRSAPAPSVFHWRGDCGLAASRSD